MSQHMCSTVTDDGEIVTVTMGYDRRLDYVFCDVDCESDDHTDPLYTNLDDDKASITQQNVEYYRPLLISMGIHLPQSMFVEVAADQINRVGNRYQEQF